MVNDNAAPPPSGSGPTPPASPFRAKENDHEDMTWALSTAEAMHQAGDLAECSRWLRRAAEIAGEHDDDVRALELAKLASDYAHRAMPPATGVNRVLSGKTSQPPPPLPGAISRSNAPPPLPSKPPPPLPGPLPRRSSLPPPIPRTVGVSPSAPPPPALARGAGVGGMMHASAAAESLPAAAVVPTIDSTVEPRSPSEGTLASAPRLMASPASKEVDEGPSDVARVAESKGAVAAALPSTAAVEVDTPTPSRPGIAFITSPGLAPPPGAPRVTVTPTLGTPMGTEASEPTSPAAASPSPSASPRTRLVSDVDDSAVTVRPEEIKSAPPRVDVTMGPALPGPTSLLGELPPGEGAAPGPVPRPLFEPGAAVRPRFSPPSKRTDGKTSAEGSDDDSAVDSAPTRNLGREEMKTLTLESGGSGARDRNEAGSPFPPLRRPLPPPRVPGAAAPPAAVVPHQAVRVTLYRERDGELRVVPAGSVRRPASVDVLLVSLDPDTDLATVFSS